MSFFDKILRFIVLIIYSIWSFFLMMIEALTSIRNCIELIGGILYQPLIFLVSTLILQSQLNSLGKTYEESGTVPGSGVVILIAFLIIIVLIANAILELGYYLFHAEERYKTIFAIQKGFYNYSLIVVSLVAFWVSYDRSLESSVNLELLFIGGFFFLCVIFTDIYSFSSIQKER